METMLKINENKLKSKFLAFAISIAALLICQNMLAEDNMTIEAKSICLENTAYYLAIADTFLVYNNLQDCLWAMNKAVKCNPANAEILHRRGMLHLQLAHFTRAIKDFNMALNLGMVTSDIYNHLGIAYYYNDKVEESENAYNKAIELNPICAKAYYNRGILRLSVDDVLNATFDFQKAMEINSNLNIENVKEGNIIACLLK